MKNLMKKYFKTENLLFVLFVLQILFIFYMNIFEMKCVTDFDSSCIMVMAREIAQQGRLFPLEYSYQTTLDLQTLVIPVAILYRLCGNLLLSQGIMDCVIVLVYIWAILHLLKHRKMEKGLKWLCLILYFIPYSVDQLGYARMLFTAGAFYTHRMLIPFLLLGIIMDVEAKQPVRKYIVRLLYLWIISYFSGLGSGGYVLLCGILPFFLWECFAAFRKDSIRKVLNPESAVIASAAFFSLLGCITQRAMGIVTLDAEMHMISADMFDSNLSRMLVGVFELFGALAEREDMSLFSFQAICIISNFVFTLLVCIAIIYSFVYVGKKDDRLYGSCASLVFLNFMVLLLLNSSPAGYSYCYRYHLVGISLVFPVLAELPLRLRHSLLPGQRRITG